MDRKAQQKAFKRCSKDIASAASKADWASAVKLFESQVPNISDGASQFVDDVTLAVRDGADDGQKFAKYAHKLLQLGGLSYKSLGS